MTETQESIGLWAAETFGEAGSNARVAARANEELAELLRAYTSDNMDKVPEEAADVAIVLARLGYRIGANVMDITSDTAVGEISAGEANYMMALCLDALMAHDDTERAAVYAGATISRLRNLCAGLGADLDAEIDRKMAINRARVWTKDGTGHGYHVRADKLPQASQ